MRSLTRSFLSICAAGLFPFVSSEAFAQSGGPYELSWSTIDAGGGISEGGVYKLASSIGQPDASPVPASGGTYTLTGGFLQDASYFPVPVRLSGLSIE